MRVEANFLREMNTFQKMSTSRSWNLPTIRWGCRKLETSQGVPKLAKLWRCSPVVIAVIDKVFLKKCLLFEKCSQYLCLGKVFSQIFAVWLRIMLHSEIPRSLFTPYSWLIEGVIFGTLKMVDSKFQIPYFYTYRDCMHRERRRKSVWMTSF